MPLEAISIIELDTSQPFLSVTHAKQYDTVRKVEAHLFFSGTKWYVPKENIYFMVSYKKADKIGGFYDLTEDNVPAVLVNGDDRSIITIAIDRNMLTKPGSVQVEVIFNDTITGDRLSSFAFIMEVEAAAIRELNVSSNPYFNILSQQITHAVDAERKLYGITATAEKLLPGESPTAEFEGTSALGDHYNIAFGIPSTPSFTASVEKLPPAAEPTVDLSGGDEIDKPYNLALGVPSMPEVTVSGSKLAPNAEPTVQISGGTEVNEPYNIAIGVPSMPGMTASVSKVKPGANPTVALTGGQSAGQAYNLALGVPSMPEVTVSGSKLAPNAEPTVQISGGTEVNEPYNIAIGVPSMPGMTASVSKVKPGANPTVALTGGQSAGQAYNLALGVPSMPEVTVSGSKLAPNAEPTVQISGGTEVNEPYNIAIGVPSMPGMTASVTPLAAGSNPTVEVTGGTTAGEAYNLAFGLPRTGGITPTFTRYAYALSTDAQTPPSEGWKASISDLGSASDFAGKYLWSRVLQTWSDGYTARSYSVAYNGLDGSNSCDSELSDTSENPVQNKVLKAKFDALETAIPAAVTVDSDFSDASENPLQNKVITEKLKTALFLYSSMTATGMLVRGKNSKNEMVTAIAKKGVAYGSFNFQLTLLADGWTTVEGESEYTQIIENTYLSSKSSQYAYVITPNGSSFAEYVDCEVYADDIDTDSYITFHAATTPTHDLTINVIRLVSTNSI